MRNKLTNLKSSLEDKITNFAIKNPSLIRKLTNYSVLSLPFATEIINSLNHETTPFNHSGDILEVGLELLVLGTGVHLYNKLKIKEKEVLNINTAVLENNPNYVLMHREGKIIYANNAVEKAGYESSDLIGKNIFDFIHPNDILTAREMYELRKRSKNSKSSDPGSYTLRFKNNFGGYIDAHVSASLVEDTKSDVIVVLSDITELKQKELELKNSEAKFKGMFETSIDGICILDENYNVLLCNDSYSRIFNKSKENIIGKTVLDVYSEVDKGKVFSECLKKNCEKNFDSLNLEVSLHDGSKKYLSFLNSKINHGSNLCFTVVRDITNSKNTEKKLTSKILEQENLIAERAKLLSVIAHDLKSPFAGILGYLEIMSDDSCTPEEYADFSKKIYSSALSFYDQLKTTLDWGNLHSGSVKISKSNFDLSEVVSESLEKFDANASLKKISFNYTPKSLPVYADPSMVGLVVNNLLSNAVKFTNVKGNIYISSEELDDYVLLKIKDTGEGIDQGTMSKLFKTTVQSRHGTNNERGTGLGLNICYDYLKLNNGDIRVESELGKGSTFYVTLPKYDSKKNL